MRLVSQHGNVDIPYEKAQIFCEMEYVLARVGKYEYTLGKYSGESKSKKVMEMVREKSFWTKDVFQFPKDEEVEI